MSLAAAATKWREAASLIILARNLDSLDRSSDYKTLLFKRHEKVSFMPESYVFPGGVCESADASPLWWHHFLDLGVNEEQLKSLCRTQGPRPPIFNTRSADSLQKDISLRITAIRETFEEVGIIFGKDRKSLKDPDHCGYGNFYENFDREHWQQLVHNDPSQFLILCRKLDIVPDLWSLHEWSAWLTPSSISKRFETVFFLVSTSQVPSLIPEKNEVADCLWKSPLAYLKSYQKKEIKLPPPQIYELSRLVNIGELEDVRKFALKRASNGTMLLLPVWYKCTNGSVGLLPGDDMYPVDPNASTVIIAVPSSILEFRAGAKKLHRYEFCPHNGSVLHLNFPLPDGHLNPVVLSPHSRL